MEDIIDGQKVVEKMNRDMSLIPNQIVVSVRGDNAKTVKVKDVVGLLYPPTYDKPIDRYVLAGKIEESGIRKTKTIISKYKDILKECMCVGSKQGGIPHTIDVHAQLIMFVRRLNNLDNSEVTTKLVAFIDGGGGGGMEVDEEDAPIPQAPIIDGGGMDVEEDVPAILSDREHTLVKYMDHKATPEIIRRGMDIITERLGSINMEHGILGVGKSIRITQDGTRMAAYDVIKIVCRGDERDQSYASKTFDNCSNEVKEMFNEEKLTGRGQARVWVGDLRAIMHLVMALPGRIAHSFRDWMITQLLRVWSGDQSLHPEIDRNAASNAPINRMSKEQLARDDVEMIEPDKERLEVERMLSLDRVRDTRMFETMDAVKKVATYSMEGVPDRLKSTLECIQAQLIDDLVKGRGYKPSVIVYPKHQDALDQDDNEPVPNEDEEVGGGGAVLEEDFDLTKEFTVKSWMDKQSVWIQETAVEQKYTGDTGYSIASQLGTELSTIFKADVNAKVRTERMGCEYRNWCYPIKYEYMIRAACVELMRKMVRKAAADEAAAKKKAKEPTQSRLPFERVGDKFMGGMGK